MKKQPEIQSGAHPEGQRQLLSRSIRRQVASGRLPVFALVLSLIWMGGLPFAVPASAETFHLGTQESEQLEAAEPVYTPRPTITEEMLEAGIKAFCVARFEIGANGKSKVHLVTSTGSAEVDELTLSTLRTWRFNPGKRGGIPVASVRKIKVEFEVD